MDERVKMSQLMMENSESSPKLSFSASSSTSSPSCHSRGQDAAPAAEVVVAAQTLPGSNNNSPNGGNSQLEIHAPTSSSSSSSSPNNLIQSSIFETNNLIGGSMPVSPLTLQRQHTPNKQPTMPSIAERRRKPVGDLPPLPPRKQQQQQQPLQQQQQQQLPSPRILGANKPPVPFRRSTNTMSSMDSDMLEKQQQMDNAGEDECDGFISQIDKDGNIEQVPVKYVEGDQPVKKDEEETEEAEEESESRPETPHNPMADFMSADILTKPFNFVSGNVSKNRFNPFRKKKAGLLNVLAKQATRQRIIAKNGTVNTQSMADGKSHHYFKDFFITLIDLSWPWMFVLFATAFSSSWLTFACVWYLTFLAHGDFDEANKANETFRPCADNIQDFTSCFLFSVETQHTIGYGGRATTEQCPFAIIVMCLQSIVGVIIQACMAGIIFAKFTIPRARGQTIVFSKNAVVTMRNGDLYLMCRITDLRKYSLLEAHVRMIVIRKEKTEEGEVIPYQQTDLECGSEIDGSNDRVLIMWPVTISHKIDEESLFHEMSPRDFLTSQFEILVTLEGVTEETGNTVQARTSYLPNEILWGHHFENASVAYDKKAEMYSVQHSIINKTVVDLTPRCSAKQLTARNKHRNSSAMTSSSSEEISPRTQLRSQDSSSTLLQPKQQ